MNRNRNNNWRNRIQNRNWRNRNRSWNRNRNWNRNKNGHWWNRNWNWWNRNWRNNDRNNNKYNWHWNDKSKNPPSGGGAQIASVGNCTSTSGNCTVTDSSQLDLSFLNNNQAANAYAFIAMCQRSEKQRTNFLSCVRQLVRQNKNHFSYADQLNIINAVKDSDINKNRRLLRGASDGEFDNYEDQGDGESDSYGLDEFEDQGDDEDDSYDLDEFEDLGDDEDDSYE